METIDVANRLTSYNTTHFDHLGECRVCKYFIQWNIKSHHLFLKRYKSISFWITINQFTTIIFPFCIKALEFINIASRLVHNLWYGIMTCNWVKDLLYKTKEFFDVLYIKCVGQTVHTNKWVHFFTKDKSQHRWNFSRLWVWRMWFLISSRVICAQIQTTQGVSLRKRRCELFKKMKFYSCSFHNFYVDSW